MTHVENVLGLRHKEGQRLVLSFSHRQLTASQQGWDQRISTRMSSCNEDAGVATSVAVVVPIAMAAGNWNPWPTSRTHQPRRCWIFSAYPGLTVVWGMFRSIMVHLQLVSFTADVDVACSFNRAARYLATAFGFGQGCCARSSISWKPCLGDHLFRQPGFLKLQLSPIVFQHDSTLCTTI